jgi:phage-related holin
LEFGLLKLELYAFMKKIILLLFVIVYSFSSCEKDDICDANTVTTRLVISFYDVTNSSILKNATNLK